MVLENKLESDNKIKELCVFSIALDFFTNMKSGRFDWYLKIRKIDKEMTDAESKRALLGTITSLGVWKESGVDVSVDKEIFTTGINGVFELIELLVNKKYDSKTIQETLLETEKEIENKLFKIMFEELIIKN